ncbi:potassium channel family protein [uncultured Ruminococcus sp.]|uniref:potassium channel family protein n=1 Tax=uncultured Ruminococcus sp. TaxID=165186 RepID=UPI000EBDE8A9|nr:potassium channel family protein [uncultured Ruminococcus sp.]HCJ40425.1 Ion channel [Ruminococcus sp.]
MKLGKTQHIVYDVVMSALAVFAAVLVLFDCTGSLSEWVRTVSMAIYALFAADLAVRTAAAPDKRRFFKINFWDAVAVLPIHGILPPLPDPRADTFLNVLNLIRIVAFLSRPLRKAQRFYNTNGFKYVVFATFMTIITGGVLIHYAEGMDFGDGIWWAFVTATTVGYGDISPSTLYGRLIAMVLMLVGIGLIGSLTSTLTSFFMNRQHKKPADAVIETVKAQLDRFDELSDDDIEQLCKVLKALRTKGVKERR